MGNKFPMVIVAQLATPMSGCTSDSQIGHISHCVAISWLLACVHLAMHCERVQVASVAGNGVQVEEERSVRGRPCASGPVHLGLSFLGVASVESDD